MNLQLSQEQVFQLIGQQFTELVLLRARVAQLEHEVASASLPREEPTVVAEDRDE